MSRRVPFLLFPLLSSGLAGCVQVPVWEQRFVAKPGMIFSGSVVLATQPTTLTQIETGRATAGGASAVGCSSCR